MIATFISTDPKPWSQLQQFGTPEAQQLVEKPKTSVSTMLTESNIIIKRPEALVE